MPRLQFQIVAGATFNTLKKKSDQPHPPSLSPPSLPLPSLIPPPPPMEKEPESSVLPPPPSETELENLLLHLETGGDSGNNNDQTKADQNSDTEKNQGYQVNNSKMITTADRPPSPPPRILKETGPLHSLMNHVAGVSINKLKTKWEPSPPTVKVNGEKYNKLKANKPPPPPPPPPPRPSKDKKSGIPFVNNVISTSCNRAKTEQSSHNPLEIKLENALQIHQTSVSHNDKIRMKMDENLHTENGGNFSNMQSEEKVNRPPPPPPPPRPSKDRKPGFSPFGDMITAVNFNTTNVQMDPPPSPPPRIPKETGPLMSLMNHVAGVSINKLKTKWEPSPTIENKEPKKPIRNHVKGAGLNTVKLKTNQSPSPLVGTPKKLLLNHVNSASLNKVKVQTEQLPPLQPIIKSEVKKPLVLNHVNGTKVEMNQLSPPLLKEVSDKPLQNPVNDGANVNKTKTDTDQPPQAEKETVNPLLNHIVLNKILSNGILSFEDVKNFRLVCSFWHNASIDFWCKNAVVKLTPNTKMRDGISVAELENRYGNKESSAQHQLHGKSYTSYKVKGWKPKYDPVNSMAIPAEFTFGPVVAPTVEYLHIEQCNFTQEEKFEEVVLPCLNLKELVLTGNTFMAHNREFDPNIEEDKKLKCLKTVKVDGIMTLGWNQLIAHAPNVKNLIFKQNSSYSRDTFSGFLSDHTQLLRRHRVKWPITHLDLSEATGSYSELGTLRFHEFPLEELTIQFEKIQVDQHIRPLLQGSVKTLKRLNIIRISDRIDPPSYNSVDFPCDVQLDMLTELYLWGCVVDHLDFFRFTPNLKILHMNRNNFERRQLMTVSKTNNNNGSSSTSEPSKKEKVEPFNENVDVVQCTVECWNNLAKQPTMLMECLEKLFLDCRLGVGSMYTLRRWLPNLKAFGIIFNNNTFHLACEEWSKLEEIWIMFGSVITDEAVSAEYFLNLKTLKKFTLDAYCNQGWFTDKAAYNGFLKMDGLRYLRICVSKQMSADAVNLLEKKITHVKIIRNYGNGTHPDYDCCQRVAFNKERKLAYDKKD